MKKATYFLIACTSFLFTILMAGFGGDNLKNSSGAPAGNTNSPGDGQNCTHCMGGSAAAVTGWITSDVPASGYLPGSTYTITVTATGTGKKGFEVSPQDLTGNLVGTLIAGTGSKLVGSNKYVTHNAAKTSNPSTWTFQWTAPAGGAGSVTFYGSIAVTQTVTKTTTLTISQSTVGYAEQDETKLTLFPNPAHDMITLSTLVDTPGVLSIELVNLQGRTVATLMKESCEAGTFKRSFPITQPVGYYFLHLNTGNVHLVKRLIVTD